MLRPVATQSRRPQVVAEDEQDIGPRCSRQAHSAHKKAEQSNEVHGGMIKGDPHSTSTEFMELTANSSDEVYKSKVRRGF